MDINKEFNKVSQELQEACEILNIIYIDASMALEGHWDKSDDGFESQQILIEKFLDKVNYKIEYYKSEELEDND